MKINEYRKTKRSILLYYRRYLELSKYFKFSWIFFEMNIKLNKFLNYNFFLLLKSCEFRENLPLFQTAGKYLSLNYS